MKPFYLAVAVLSFFCVPLLIPQNARVFALDAANEALSFNEHPMGLTAERAHAHHHTNIAARANLDHRLKGGLR